MRECFCLRDHPEDTIRRINTLAEELSVDLILAIVEENLCPQIAQILSGKILAALAARIYLMDIGHVEAEKIEGLDILQLPGTRKILEVMASHARTLTEDSSLART